MRAFVAIEIYSNEIINLISKFQSEININAKPVESHNFILHCNF